MEALSSMPLSLDEVTAVVDNPEMWAYYDSTVKNCKRDKPVSSSDLAISTAALLALLTFKNGTLTLYLYIMGCINPLPTYRYIRYISPLPTYIYIHYT